MNACPPPPDAGEVITSTVTNIQPPTHMSARKCRDGSWRVAVIGKDGNILNELTIPGPETK